MRTMIQKQAAYSNRIRTWIFHKTQGITIRAGLKTARMRIKHFATLSQCLTVDDKTKGKVEARQYLTSDVALQTSRLSQAFQASAMDMLRICELQKPSVACWCPMICSSIRHGT